MKPHPAFDAEIDAQTLRTAMKGLGRCKGLSVWTISGLVSQVLDRVLNRMGGTRLHYMKFEYLL